MHFCAHDCTGNDKKYSTGKATLNFIHLLYLSKHNSTKIWNFFQWSTILFCISDLFGIIFICVLYI